MIYSPTAPPPASPFDSTAAFASAIAWHPELVSIPPGVIYANISLAAKRGVTIRGAGRDLTTIRNYAPGVPVFTFDNTASDCKLNVLEGLRITSRDSSSALSTDGIVFSGNDTNENDFHTFRNIEIVDMRHGIHLTRRTIWNTWQDVHVYSCSGDGLRCHTDGNSNEQCFYTCRFGQNGGNGIWLKKDSGDPLLGWHFYGCTFEKNAECGVRVSGSASGVNGLQFFGGHMEENATGVSTGSTNPRKANIFVEASLASHVIIDGMTLEGAPAGFPPLDWSIFVSSAIAVGRIGPNRHGATAQGMYNLSQGFWVEPQLGTIGNSVANRNGNLVFTDFVGSSGAFTPVLLFNGVDGGATYSNQIGRYVRHGNVMDFSIYISLTSKGGATGAASIGGLPLPALNVTNLSQPVTIAGDQLQSSVNDLLARVAPNGQSILLTRFFSGVQAPLTDADCGNFTSFNISGRVLLL